MKPWSHLIITLIVIAFYHPSLEFVIAFFLAGIFIDIDHIFDYLIFFKGKKSLRNFLFQEWWQYCRKVVLIFHGYEVLLLLFILLKIFGFEWLSGLFFGALLHISLDVIFNVYVSEKGNKNPLVYSLFYRTLLGFETEQVKKS